MTTQQIVKPSRIEPELLRIWEDLAKENRMRASLFNLIIFSRLSERTDYIRSLVQGVVEKFPCRSLFISFDANSSHAYLKTAVSVVIPKFAGSNFACDQIDIGVAGTEFERVPFVLLPHLIPDLPIYLLWAEDPSQPHPLFFPLSRLATRMIFDSESTDHLTQFAKTLLQIKKKSGLDIADLNWARTQDWRDLITSTFDSTERIFALRRLSFVKIVYNACRTEFFCHLQIQAMYLLAWLSSRLDWKFQRMADPLEFQFEKVDAKIESENWDQLAPGKIISIFFQTSDGHVIEAVRCKDQTYVVNIQISSPDKCDLPYHFILEKTARAQSLIQEICNTGTSLHYMSALKQLERLHRESIC